jgi:hypothetical protein
MTDHKEPCVQCGTDRTARKDRPEASGRCWDCFNTAKQPAAWRAACPGCGKVRNVKPTRSQRPNHTGLCRACWRDTLRGLTVVADLPADDDDSPIDLAETGGRWVLERGIRVWREDVPA